LDRIFLKIELIGANSCRRWHHDHFVGRSIVTYSGMHGTTFCDSPSTSLEDMVKGDVGASVQTAEVGDILFIKGAKYDASGDGCSSALIHKSPDVSHRSDGSVITRLCLKVDADNYSGSQWWFINPEY
jgi:hypothetical protein